VNAALPIGSLLNETLIQVVIADPDELCKIEVRHILFKKIRFSIFLNNQLTVYYATTYCLKRKN